MHIGNYLNQDQQKFCSKSENQHDIQIHEKKRSLDVSVQSKDSKQNIDNCYSDFSFDDYKKDFYDIEKDSQCYNYTNKFDLKLNEVKSSLKKQSRMDCSKNSSNEDFTMQSEISNLKQEIENLKKENNYLQENQKYILERSESTSEFNKNIFDEEKNSFVSRESAFLTPAKRIKFPKKSKNHSVDKELYSMDDTRTNLSTTIALTPMANSEKKKAKYEYEELSVVSESPFAYKSVLLDNGDTYFGKIITGKFEGYGVLTYANNDKLNRNVFKGYFQNSLRHGYGTLKFKNGNKFKGLCENDMANGQGEFIYSNGEKYVGNFCDDKATGVGEYFYNNEDIYKGNWLNNMKNGYGEMIYSNGNIYKGDFYNNRFDGYGELTYYRHINDQNKLSERYEGIFSEGKKHGFGKLSMFDCNAGDTVEIFEGEFENGIKNGIGKFIDKNGDTWTGVWEKNIIKGFTEIAYKNGEKYTGKYNFDKNCYTGYGVKIDQDKNKFKGHFSQGKKNGFGEQINHSDTQIQKIVSFWHKDLMADYGIIHFTDGSVFEGKAPQSVEKTQKDHINISDNTSLSEEFYNSIKNEILDIDSSFQYTVQSKSKSLNEYFTNTIPMNIDVYKKNQIVKKPITSATSKKIFKNKNQKKNKKKREKKL